MALEKEFFVPVDMHGLQIINHRLHMHSSNPSSPNEGDIWYNSTTHEPTLRTIRGSTSSNRALIADDDDFHNRLSVVSTIQDADELLIWDDSVSLVDHKQQYRRVSRTNFLDGLSTIQNTYKRVIADTGTQNMDASGEDDIAIAGDGTIIETFGVATGQKTLSLVWKNQTENYILAGPASGGAGTPTFRTTVDADMPTSYSPGQWDSAYSHSLITTGNPHNVTYTDIGGLWLRTITVLSPINVGDSLSIDVINEEALHAGVTVESILFKDGGMTLLTGATVDTIETTLTNDDTHIPTSGAVFDQIAGGTHYKGEYNAATNTPDLDTSPSGIMIGDMYTVTVDGTFFTEAVQAGDFLISEETDPTLLTDWTVVNKNIPPYTFLNLGDSPASYSATGGFIVMVNSVPDALEFIDPSGYGLSNFNDDLGHVEMNYPGAGIALSTGSAWNSSITNNSGNWNTAYGWGDHSGLYANLSHTHGNITNAGAIGSTANLPIITTTAGVLIVSSFGTGGNTFCVGNDSRLSNARTPTQHAMDSATYHTSSDITTLNATTSKHGFLRKLGGGSTNFLRADGTWAAPPGSGMVYPGAGIALSTESAWGTSITNNSGNWNTAYSHSTDNSQAHSDYMLNTGDTVSGTYNFGDIIYANAVGTGLDVLHSATIGNHLEVGDNLTVDTNTLFVNATTHRVGIGVTNPGRTLEIVSRAGIDLAYWKSGANDANSTFLIRNSDNDDLFDLDANGDFYIKGNVGIGTSSPGTKLEIASTTTNNTLMTLTSDDADSGIVMTNDTSSYQMSVRNDVSDKLVWRINAVDKVTLDTSGKVGIGTVSPDTILVVSGGHGGGDSHAYSRLTVEDDTHAAISILTPNTAEGFLMFGDPEDSFVAGFAYSHDTNVLRIMTNNAYQVTIDSTGDVEIIGDVTASDFVLSSDIILKKNIVTVRDGLKIALSLRPVHFDWKDDRDNFDHIGFIAQDMEKIRPELVKNSDHKYISYSTITAINNAAIHVLNTKIETNEEKIIRLEKRVKELENERS